MRYVNCAALTLSVIALIGCSTGPKGGADEVAIESGVATEFGDFTAALARYNEEQSFLRSFGREMQIADVRWTDDACYVRRDGQWSRVSLSRGSITGPDAAEVSPPPAPERARPLPRPVRGRQRAEEPSPCGRWLAVCVDHNVIVRPVHDEGSDGANKRQEIVVTTEGTRRLGYGRASWVYGEELAQNTGMWWSPCSEWLAFYRFDDRDVPDFHLVSGWTRGHTRILSEPYPKPGDPNPVAEIRLFHMPTGVTSDVDVRALADPDELEFYIYRISFSSDSSSLLFHRLNRHQNHLELLACDPEYGDVRLLTEERQATWQNYRPTLRFLEDGRRFLWETDRWGYSAYELRDLDGGPPLATFAIESADVDGIDAVVEGAGGDPGFILFSAFGNRDPHDRHPYVAPLDGSAPPLKVITNPGRHDLRVAPDGEHFIATRQSADHPASFSLHRTRDGVMVADLGGVDPDALVESGRSLPERFVVTAADGVTPLHGVLFRPANVRPGERLPLVVQVYGGPGFRAVSGRFSPGNAATAFGWYVMQLDGRGASGRGKEFMGEVYRRLGEVEVDDHAAAVHQLLERFPEIDPDRVGIFGHSYGGYLTIMAMLRYPELFRVGSAGAPVTDWRQYDTIYTERYMRTPAENPEGYDTGSAVVHAEKLKGDLLILHGMVDDNVHPNNVFAMIRVLQDKDIPFTMMFYPNAGHGLPAHAQRLRWQFLFEHLLRRTAP